MIHAWRVGRAVYADLSGEGARRHGGRWNSPGLPMVYLAEHPALAVLEVRVHLDLPPDLLPDDYVLMRVDLPDEPPEEVAAMPPHPREVGDNWLSSGRTAVLRVPSIIVPTATNLLLNPRHPRAADAQVSLAQPFRFDARPRRGTQLQGRRPPVRTPGRPSDREAARFGHAVSQPRRCSTFFDRPERSSYAPAVVPSPLDLPMPQGWVRFDRKKGRQDPAWREGRSMRSIVAGALMLALALPARAQTPITVVVNFVAGGPSDLMARLLAPELSSALGSPVVVKNSPGAAGTIGVAEVARARPDGTTLLLSPVGAMAIQPSFRTDLPYKPADLVPICQVADTPVVVMAAPNSDIRTVADLVSRAHEARGAFNFASTGPGSMPHIASVALARAEGVEMTHIPYRGNAEAVTALLRGDVGVFADQPGTLRANNLQALAIMAERRTTEFPETPTMRELGHDLVYSIWSGLFAPAGTSADFLKRVEGACQTALQSTAVIEGFKKLATPIMFRNQRDFARFWQEELAKFQGILKSAGIRAGD